MGSFVTELRKPMYPDEQRDDGGQTTLTWSQSRRGGSTPHDNKFMSLSVIPENNVSCCLHQKGNMPHVNK
jgi:hypothetical protein